MRRLYFLVPNVESAKKINDELLLARVEERHIHIIAKEGTPMEDLPEASLTVIDGFWQPEASKLAIRSNSSASMPLCRW